MNLLKSTHLWISWVYLMDSGIPGPTVAISACTHGGEHAWLKAINYLVHVLEINKHLIKGRLYCILTNIKAYEQSITEGNNDPESNRFIEANLNRCCTQEDMDIGKSYEARRAKELEGILKWVGYHLDIHSVYKEPSKAIAIATKKSSELVTKVLNVDSILEGLTQVQIWRPFIDITERHGGIWIWLEAWYELDGTWFEIWVENSLRLLASLGMLPQMLLDHKYSRKENKLIRIHGAIVPMGIDFDTVKELSSGDIIKAWELIWMDSTGEYRAKKDSIVLMPAKPEAIRRKLSQGSNPEEFCFLGDVW